MQPVPSNNSDQQIVVRVRPAKAVFDWFKDGFNIFNQNKLAWIGITLAVYIIFILPVVLPVVAQILCQFIVSILFAGLYSLAHTAYHAKKFEHIKVLDGFKESLVPLILLTLVNMLGVLICSAFAAHLTDLNSVAAPNLADFYDFSIVFLLLYAPILLIMMFAPALVILHKFTPIQAIKVAFIGTFKNTLSLTVFSVITSCAILLALVLGGIGIIFVLPILHCILYIIFQDIFHSRTPFVLESQPEDEDSMYV